MGNIVLLDELTINKIAAGEVIERPASVVKELVENSIDAGAKNITVEIKNGGIAYIRITDDGKGFLPDDMEIAFERHATSKIRKADDLEIVKSMGFRGEALASIAAISKIELVSKIKDSDVGYKIVVEGGNIIEKQETGCQKGTSITVQNLFYNTPVRYKFLKKDFTESGYIEDAITRIALVNPDIAIKLINNGKTIVQTSGNGELKDVIYSVYGKEIAEGIKNVKYDYDDMEITGVIGKPSIARSNRSNQLFFVNKRFVKDKTLLSAAEQAFKGMVTIGKYGFLILNIEIDPHKVDVNVHPAKLEVRFENESGIFKLVYHAIKESLLKQDFLGDTDRTDEKKVNEIINTDMNNTTSIGKIENIVKTEEKKIDYCQSENEFPNISNYIEQIYNKKMGLDEFLKQNKEESIINGNSFQNISISNNSEDLSIKSTGEMNLDNNLEKEQRESQFKCNSEGIEVKIDKEEFSEEKSGEISPIDEVEEKIRQMLEQGILEKNAAEDLLEENKQGKPKKSFEEMYERTFGKLPINPINLEELKEEYILDELDAKPVENISLFNREDIISKPNYKIIGVVFSTYIILEINKEMYIIDQHAAHERIMYEKIKKNYYSKDAKDSQIMLLPDIINLTYKEMGIAKDNWRLFENAGFVLEEFGDNTIKLIGVPNVCIDLDTKQLFLETLDEINTVARTAKQEIEEKFIATIACKAAVKANMALAIPEIENLMNELLRLPNPFTCPHGRPTAIQMSKNEIEKKFSRR